MLKFDVSNWDNYGNESGAFVEFEEETKGTLLDGLNVYVLSSSNDFVISNIVLSYKQVLALNKFLNKKIEEQI